MSARAPLAVVSLLAAAPLAHGQSIDALCRHFLHPPTGAWSEFRLEGGRNEGATMRLAVVGTERRGDSTYEWVETAMHGMRMMGPDTGTFIAKSLVQGFGPGMADPQEVILKMPGRPAMIIKGPGAAHNGTGADEIFRRCRQGRVVGRESVTVPAGTFSTIHIASDSGQGDVWVAEDLPLGLVKVMVKAPSSGMSDMVLTAHGMGAKTAITETPVPFNPGMLMGPSH